MLTRSEARRYYDRFGPRQDRQAFYEDAAGVWNAVHSLRPRIVGGCRPVVGAELLDEARWRIEHRQVISRWGIASEILVARRRGA